MHSILTPLALWRKFDDSQPLNEFIVKREEKDGILYSFLCFSGRKTETGRVRIYGLFARPAEGESFPAILLLPDAGKGFDRAFIARFVRLGYAVFTVDYSGKDEGRERYTVYPEDIPYANFATVGRHMDYVDDDAIGTSWYEWTAVGRYALKYLKSRPDVSKIGVIGIRTGGEIAWKLMLSPDVSCGVPICAAGWIAYRGINKFQKDNELLIDNERQRFLAGVDSQSYAQFVSCPVLMLCSTNDGRFDYDRAYDTYSRINSKVDCVISYTVNNSSYIGPQGLTDLDMFLAKYLKRQHVFIPKPLDITVFIDEEGDLVANVKKDNRGESVGVHLFLAEDCLVSSQRDWRESRRKKKENENSVTFYLDAYENAKTVFVFAQAEYSSGFTASSKIAFKEIDGAFRNGIPRTRILYSTEEGNADCFACSDVADYSFGDCILDGSVCRPVLTDAFKGIKGVCSERGLKTFRINNPIYRPSEDALISIDFCGWEAGFVCVRIAEIQEGRILPYVAKVWLNGSRGWENSVLQPGDFKTQEGQPLKSFSTAISLSFTANFKFCLNNILWL